MSLFRCHISILISLLLLFPYGSPDGVSAKEILDIHLDDILRENASERKWVSNTKAQIARKRNFMESSIIFQDSIPGTDSTKTMEFKELEEVLIKGTKNNHSDQSKSILPIVVYQEELMHTQNLSLVQSLSSISGVQSATVTGALAKPMIRGMGFFRVVFADNGLKYEGQQWSTHHGLSIDKYDVQRVEIIKGASAIKYGSDAIGGVINILPFLPPSRDTFYGHSIAEARTNSQWLGTSKGLFYRKGNFYVSSTLSYHSFGDFRVPNTEEYWFPSPGSLVEASHRFPLENTIANTAGRELAASFKAGYQGKNQVHYIDIKYNKIKLGFFDWVGMRREPLSREHNQNSRDILLPFQAIENLSAQYHSKFFFGEDILTLAVGYQQNSTQEHSLLFDRTGRRAEKLKRFQEMNNLDLHLFLQTFSGNLEYKKTFFPNFSWDLGMNLQAVLHNKDGFNHILPNYQRNSTGLYTTAYQSLTEKSSLSAGLRIDYMSLSIAATPNPETLIATDLLNAELNNAFLLYACAIGWQYRSSQTMRWAIDLSRSFRIPSVYELSAFGIHRHEGRFEQGNSNLDPEVSYQLNTQSVWDKGNFQIEVQAYLNYFTNYLYLFPTPRLHPIGQIFEYTQSQALFTGTEMQINYTHRSLYSSIGLEYVYAVNTSALQFIPFTPPPRISHLLQYTFKSKANIDVPRLSMTSHYIFAQNNVVPNELKTPGAILLDLQFVFSTILFNRKLECNIACHNLFNTRYFNHISFYRRIQVPEPGRDIQCILKFNF